MSLLQRPSIRTIASGFVVAVCALTVSSSATAQTRVDGYRGYNQPNQYLTQQPTTLAPNLEPAMVHKAQDDATQKKLADLQKKFGKKPNIVVFLTDDTGWLDYGFNGGGQSVGNPTPDLDRVAASGLINPQEDESVGIRHIPMTVPLLDEQARYKEVLKKYPGRVQVGF